MTRPVMLTAIGLASLALAGCTAGNDDDGPSTGDAVLAQLRAIYVDKPLKGGQETPSHTFLIDGPGHFLFLHWNDPDVAAATGLAFVGDAFAANGCVGSGGVSQEQIDAGYVHFHKESAASWDQGHHTDPDDPGLAGYWFRHVAAGPDVDPMDVGASPPGEVYPLMPSHENAPACSLIP